MILRGTIRDGKTIGAVPLVGKSLRCENTGPENAFSVVTVLTTENQCSENYSIGLQAGLF